MPAARGIVVGLMGCVLTFALTACRPALANETLPRTGIQGVTAAAATLAPQGSDGTVWGRIPYCNCLAGTATASVERALKDAGVTTSVKELSPRDGWLYFVVTFDSYSATREQVQAAVKAGGAEVLDSPP